ncbi:M15 family metallopeptidase [Ruminococcus sp.]|uniref:M15 family metallopeptidase n=1 Tax=Ruminococcus sp. TaxID=41978 RepID=UPI0025D35232|nr:M15 family metallopeptidase [Ruminococcus sp.]
MKRISKITLILMAAASMTACGKVGERSSLPIPQQPATAVTEAATETAAEELTTVTDTTTSAAAEGSETVTTTSTEADVTAASTAENTAAAPAQQQSAQSQSSAASADSNYGPAPVQYDIPGLTYINGVLIANKSYSLPADFNPGLDSTCYNQFCKLSSAAAQEGLNIYLSSGFRSYNDQAQIYNNYVAREPNGQAAADTYSARPGYSEHQTGLAIDVNQIDDSFIGTPEAIWLENHCHEFGFILRYPQGKQDITGYQYESWHIRYVGTDLATQIHASGLTLEEYFGIDSYYH